MRGKYKQKQPVRYYSFSDYLKQKFNKKVYKIALDGGMTCPNRDGLRGDRGCIFCSAGGSGDFAVNALNNLEDAISQAKLKVKDKTNQNAFIAYFQSYTNTYAPVDYLRKLFLPVIQREDIVALSIATRPDCLGKDVLCLIEELCKIKPVFIELGLQTIHEESAQYIRRGYALSCFDEAVDNLNKVGANVVVHLIMGLPNESKEQMLESVKYVASKDINGVKLHLLHVLKNTDLATEYELNKFATLTKEEYYSIIADAIELLPKKVVIHRLTGDAPKKLLIAPAWSANKKDVLNGMQRYFNEHDVLQGKSFTNK